MKHGSLNIPPEDGSTLVKPALDSYAEALETSRSLAMDTLIGGQKLRDLAHQARKELIAGAIKYTSALKLDPGRLSDPALPIIATGHQPALFHPGINLKAIAMRSCAKRLGAISVFLSQDGDELKSPGVPYPHMNKKLTRKEFTIFPQTGKTVYEKAELESPAKLVERLTELRKTMDHPILSYPAGALDRFLERLAGYSIDTTDYTSLLVIMRRAWEEPVINGYLDFPIAKVCASDIFRLFCHDLLTRIKDFARIYNSELARYRADHKLRYPVNPFPDLSTGADWIEAPFWAISGKTRERLRIIFRSQEILLTNEHLPETALSTILTGEIQVRPLAIVLSIYQRLFLCDLFIHGIGGAKYDTITDRIIKRFYGITPPPFACVTGTLFPNILSENSSDELSRQERALRDMEQRPETMASRFPLIEDAVAALATEKELLVNEIKKPNADKKQIGSRIRQLNQEMSQRLEPYKHKVMEEIEHLQALENERKVAHARDYPFFLYTPEQVASMLE